jgi:hypothetical protein
VLDEKFDNVLDEVLKDEYVAEMNQIKAPRDLIDKTKLAMAETLDPNTPGQSSKKVVKVNFRGMRTLLAVVAAVTVMIGGSLTYLHLKDRVTIVAVSPTQLSMDKNWGKFNPSGATQKKEPIALVESVRSTIIPEFMAKVTPSQLAGQKIQLAQDGDTYYAAFTKGQRYYFVTGKGVSQKTFITFLKNKLKKL